jgi:predicted anti-sigma-YlaC factor YlaD
MECDQAREELASRLITEAGGPWPEAVTVHVEACAACRAELETLRETWALLARWPEVRPGEEVRARLLRQVRRRLVRESVTTVAGWTPAVLAAAVGVGLSLGLSLLIPYSALVSLCRKALQVTEAHAGAYLLAGLMYGLPLAAGAWLIARRAVVGAVVGSLEASLLFLLILAPYVVVQCREFAPALQVAFVSGLAGGALVSSLAALGLARLVPFGKAHHA